MELCKRKIAIILIIMILLPVIVQADQSTNQTTTTTTTIPAKPTMRADFYLVAVTGGKHEKGVLVPVTITIRKGNGTIRVMAGGEVGETTLESTLVGVKLASLLAGVDWRNYDYNVTFHTESGIDGPSGSMMITLVVYTLLSRSPTGTGYTGFIATGAISPDTLASSVGAVDVKCSKVTSEGKQFFYPLVNKTVRLVEDCKGNPYTGLFNLTSQVFGVKEPLIQIVTLLPEGFNQTMTKAAEIMINQSMNLFQKAKEMSVSNSTLIPVLKYINESRQVISKHPYSAASLAFTALNSAYQAYLLGIVLKKDYKEAKKRLDKMAENVSESLNALEDQLNNMPRKGSMYYLEFLATAYTRIAAAKSSILAYEKYSTSQEGLLQNGIRELAHASARILSIKEWIAAANASREEKPVLGEEDISRLANILKDYSISVISYAKTLAEYVVKYYGRSQTLLVYIDVLDNLNKTAEKFMRTHNYLAAIGFYREALSESLRMMFQASIQAYRGPGDVRITYARELERTYGILASKLLLRGYSLGLAPAYYDYAHVLGSLGDKDGLVMLLDEAVVSEIVWLLSSTASTTINKTAPVITPTPIPNREKPRIALLLTIVALAFFLFGYILSIRNLSRILKPY